MKSMNNKNYGAAGHFPFATLMVLREVTSICFPQQFIILNFQSALPLLEWQIKFLKEKEEFSFCANSQRSCIWST